MSKGSAARTATVAEPLLPPLHKNLCIYCNTQTGWFTFATAVIVQLLYPLLTLYITH